MDDNAWVDVVGKVLYLLHHFALGDGSGALEPHKLVVLLNHPTLETDVCFLANVVTLLRRF